MSLSSESNYQGFQAAPFRPTARVRTVLRRPVVNDYPTITEPSQTRAQFSLRARPKPQEKHKPKPKPEEWKPPHAKAVPVVNADFRTLDVTVANNALAVQPRVRNNFLRSTCLTRDGLPQNRDNVQVDGNYPYVGVRYPLASPQEAKPVTFALPWPAARDTPIVVTEIVMQISGLLGQFDSYAGVTARANPNSGIYIFPGTVEPSERCPEPNEGALTSPLPIRTLGDYLLYGTMETSDFEGTVENSALLHQFRIPLGTSDGQGVVLHSPSAPTIRVVINGMDFTRFRNVRQHKFFVRWYPLDAR